MDAFFASCIELREPHLKNQPLAIGNANLRSIVSTANYSARSWGIKTGMPLYKAKKLCPNLVVREPDFHYFSQLSSAVWQILNKFCPRMETISIDEAYLDVSHLWPKYGSPNNLASVIQESVYKKLGLTCSIGIAPNRFLAKMASELEKPKGITTLFKEEIESKLWPLPIEQMWGVGVALAPILRHKYHLLTIGDLAKCDLDELTPHFSKNFLSLYQNAQGYGDTKVNPYQQLPKSVGNEITLDWPINEWDGIHEVLWLLTKNALSRLKQWHLLTKTVQVSFRYQWKGEEDFDKQKHHRRHSKQFTMIKPTDSLEPIFVHVQSLFNQLYQLGKPLILISVSLHNLVQNQHFHQASWEEPAQNLDAPELNQMVIDLNHKFKKPIAFLGNVLAKQDIVPHQNYADEVTHSEIRKRTRQKK